MSPPGSGASSSAVPRLAVGAVVFDRPLDPLRVLLVRRARPPAAGRWTLPGGKVELGEKLVTAVRRELREETGLEVEPIRLLDAVEIIDAAYHFVVLDYLCRMCGGELRPGDDAADVAWFALDDAGAMEQLTSSVRRMIDRGRDALGAADVMP